MENKPALVIMAAGMGSRYGGLKQIDPIDGSGHIIMDYSIYDALAAGFGKVVFVIKKENKDLFREVIGDRIAKQAEVLYAFQDLADIPEGFEVPEGRINPWGTGHAVRACRHLIDGPFAVINADDYYGKEAFRILYEELTDNTDPYRFVMAGYRLGNTLTENGHVARGVCRTDENGLLADIHERTQIVRAGMVPENLRTEEIISAGAAYTEDGGASWTALPEDSVVSLNVWGFTRAMMDELDRRFPAFLEKALAENPLKAEFFLPSCVDDLIKEGLAKVRVRTTEDVWYGVTYREDRPKVVEALAAYVCAGEYRWSE